TIAHLAMYKTQEFIQALPEQESGLLKNFVIDWQKRLDRLINLVASEELMANLFAYSMLDYEDKFGWGETKNDFRHMLQILKDNGLAFKPNTSAKV
ncbi:MAG TPA: hypothetical protein VHA74_03810, partial [Candidatus Dojkabacteria bacterium]|nr:hypothetical protein [Candidatus Dojkabacteria bacterium]